MAVIPAGHNIFLSKSGDGTLVYRNDTNERESLCTIETNVGHSNNTYRFEVKPEDQLKMALSVLGIGRVTDEVEGLANYSLGGRTVDELLRFAVINLRAAILLKEQQEQESEQDLDDAYALYRLAYPNAAVTRSEFPDQSMSKFWLANIRKIRKDPTVLGAL